MEFSQKSGFKNGDAGGCQPCMVCAKKRLEGQ